MLLPDRFRREDGFAMPAALMAIITLTSLSAIFMAVATTQLGATARSRDFESSLHAAEAGAESVVTRVNKESSFVSGPNVPATFTPDERSWAIGVAQAAVDKIVVPTGWAYGFRPNGSDGRPGNVIYGVGAVAGVGGQDIRVVKMHFDGERYRPDYAVLSKGTLRISSPSTVTGPSGKVHSNGAQTLSSTPTIDLGATTATTAGTTGTYRDVGGATASPQSLASQDVPTVLASTYYENRYDYAFTTSGQNWFAQSPTPPASQYAGPWWDMCINVGQPNAEIRVPAPRGQNPCTGALVLSMPRVSCGSAVEGTTMWKGWHPHDKHWHVCHQMSDGIFYAHGQAEPTKVDKEYTDSSKVTIISQSGVEMKGTRNLTPYMDGMLLHAEGAITMEGTQNLAGAIATQQHLTWTGSSSTLNGAILTGNASGSQTVISGPRITYDGSLSVPLDGVIRLVGWVEL